MPESSNAPDHLIALETTAEAARTQLAGLEGEERQAQIQAWREAAEALRAGISAHAAETGQSRYEVEMAVKKAVRHPEPEA
jgi:hypothetical protein